MAKIPPKTPPLERMAPAVAGVLLAHVVVGVVLWFVPSFIRSTVRAIEAKHQPGRYWFSPETIRMETAPANEAEGSQKAKPTQKTITAEPPNVPQQNASASNLAPAPAVSSVEQPGAVPVLSKTQGKPVNRIITLSPVRDEARPDAPLLNSRPPITMMDVLNLDKLEKTRKEADGGADMDPVLRSLEEALLTAWVPPPLEEIAPLNRDVRLRFEIERNGSVPVCKLVKASGSVSYDETALAAGQSVKKILHSLPASFPKDRYIVEVNFHIE